MIAPAKPFGTCDHCGGRGVVTGTLRGRRTGWRCVKCGGTGNLLIFPRKASS